MSAAEPVIYQPSYKARIVHFFFYLCLGLLFVYLWNVLPNHRYLPFVLLFLVIAYTVGTNWVIQSRIMKAVRMLEQDGVDKAVAEMKRIVAFFERYSWIDRYRAIVVLNSSAIGFREMALYNIGYFYLQAGHKSEAKDAFRRVLDLYPENILAKRSLKTFDTIEQSDTP